jgi:hypothetical protein
MPTYNTYTLNLVPPFIDAAPLDNKFLDLSRNFGSDSGLDEHIVNGKTLQRTGYITTTVDGNPQLVKVTEASDGGIVTDQPQTLSDLSWILG